MSVDFSKIQMSSINSSLKLLLEGNGVISFPAITSSTGGTVWQTVTVAHNYGSDNLLFQAGFNEVDGTYHNAMMAPFEAGDGSLNAFATLDATNLYINLGWQTNSALPAISFQYIYRLLVP